MSTSTAWRKLLDETTADLGKELDLFSIQEEGPGFLSYIPKGW
jgi:threonyl-tRNA synthetase